MYHTFTFVSAKIAVWPVATLELGKDKHTFVTHLESTNSGDLLEVWCVLVFIWYEIVVKIKMKISLWNLILHDNSIGNSINDSCGNSLEEVIVFSFIVPSVPGMFVAVLCALHNKDGFLTVH